MSVSASLLSKRGLFSLLVLVCSTAGLTAAGAAQDRTASDEEIPAADHFSRAKVLVQELYPDLLPNRHAEFVDEGEWGYSGVITSFYLVFRDYFPAKTNPNGIPSSCMEEVFMARFLFNRFSKDNELLSFFTSPPATGPSSRFAELVRANPNWTDAQIIQALKEAGAKFGCENRTQLLNVIPSMELKPYIGELKVKSTQFGVLRPMEKIEGVGVGDSTICSWRVDVIGRLASGAERDYLLLFEAFGGRLFSIQQHFHP